MKIVTRSFLGAFLLLNGSLSFADCANVRNSVNGDIETFKLNLVSCITSYHERQIQFLALKAERPDHIYRCKINRREACNRVAYEMQHSMAVFTANASELFIDAIENSFKPMEDAYNSTEDGNRKSIIYRIVSDLDIYYTPMSLYFQDIAAKEKAMDIDWNEAARSHHRASLKAAKIEMNALFETVENLSSLMPLLTTAVTKATQEVKF